MRDWLWRLRAALTATDYRAVGLSLTATGVSLAGVGFTSKTTWLTVAGAGVSAMGVVFTLGAIALVVRESNLQRERRVRIGELAEEGSNLMWNSIGSFDELAEWEVHLTDWAQRVNEWVDRELGSAAAVSLGLRDVAGYSTYTTINEKQTAESDRRHKAIRNAVASLLRVSPPGAQPGANHSWWL